MRRPGLPVEPAHVVSRGRLHVVTPRPVDLRVRLTRPPARLDLAELPTPVERAAWLDGPATSVWIKRDDRSSSIYGGGKVRKLEWILANPPYDDARPIVSVGGTGSHHLLALALFLRARARQLHAWVFEQTWTPHVQRNFAVLVSLGTRLWPVPTRAQLPLAALAYYGWDAPPVIGTYMAAGASTPLGCFGFVEAGLELAGQIAAGELPHPDAIYVTAGSAGTSAGLVLGLALAGVRTELRLVSSVERWAFNRGLLELKLRAAHAALRAHGLPEAQRRSASQWIADAGVTIAIDHAQVGGGYGVPTEAARAACELGRAHGLALETTYTGKCVAAVRAHEGARRGKPRNVLVWNTHAGNDLSRWIVDDWRTRSPIAVPELR